jgi:hypothetical protein
MKSGVRREVDNEFISLGIALSDTSVVNILDLSNLFFRGIEYSEVYKLARPTASASPHLNKINGKNFIQSVPH